MIPRLVVAAPSSGAGKTTVATGLMAAFRQRGLVVSPHKVGPDYIDPGYHALATGRPGRNLDPVMVGESLVGPLFLHGARGADLAVVEGVMGLFDGRGSTGEGSTAHVAHLLAAPVVLVVDASSQSTSVAALVHGFQTYDPTLRVAGVVLNRVATDRHEGMLRDALAGVTEVLGVLRRDAQVETPSRHLGLVPVAERAPEAVATVERLGELVAASVDLDRVHEIACSAGDLDAEPWAPPVVERDVRPVVALAGGAAFTFAYAETAEALEAAGADVVVVDPLRDSALPEGTAALVLPGGFPEVYTEQILANQPFLASVRAHLDAGRPTYAECAGLLLLCKSLDGVEMVGRLDATATMTSRLTLGYRTATAPAGSLLGPAGTVVTGHEFHRTTVEPRAGAHPAWVFEDGQPEGFTGAGVHASYLHLHPAAVPQLALSLVSRAANGMDVPTGEAPEGDIHSVGGGLVVGVGARAATTVDELDSLLVATLHEHGLRLEDVRLVTTVEARAELAGALAARHGWRLTTHAAEALAATEVPTPSAVVEAAVGTAGVAEAAALQHGDLLVPKTATGAATVAIARLR